MTTLIGMNFSATFTAAELKASGAGFGPGSRGTDYNGKEYVFVKATAAIAQYDAVTFDETYQTVVAPASTSNDAVGDKIGVAPAAIASGSYGWVQVYGPCTVNAVASTAANAKCGTSGTAGHVDDATSATGTISGLVLTAARGGSAPTAAILNYPFIDAIVA